MTDVLDSIRRILVPIHKEGYLFIAIAAVLTFLLGSLWSPLGWLGAILTAWVCYFFRDPQRITPLRDGLVVSPADGRVSLITTAVPPAELELPQEPMMRVSVFMNVFDCHVNRTPVTGRILQILYTPGLFLNAELDKASAENERNGLVIQSPNGTIACVQIAGLVARRILCWSGVGESIAVGERFGLIRFGSRVDVYLPADAAPRVAVGQTAVAGETVIAEFSAGAITPLVRVS